MDRGRGGREGREQKEGGGREREGREGREWGGGGREKTVYMYLYCQ